MAITNSRDEALDLLVKVRREYVGEARAVAIKLHLNTGQPITIDDVRRELPPPEGIDGRVMGAILRHPEWIKTGYVNSKRKACHNRPISTFIWAGWV